MKKLIDTAEMMKQAAQERKLGPTSSVTSSRSVVRGKLRQPNQKGASPREMPL